MPPKAYLKQYLTIEELKIRYRQAPDTIESRRWHLLLLIAQQWSIKKAAQVVGLNYDYAKEIVGRYNREGPESVKNRNADSKCDHNPHRSERHGMCRCCEANAIFIYT